MNFNYKEKIQQSPKKNTDNNTNTVRNTSPDNSQFKQNVRELFNFNPNNIEQNQEKKLHEYLVYFKNITKKSKYQLKVLDSLILTKFVIPYLFSYHSNMENNLEATKIFVNIAKNKNHHFKLTPEQEIFKDLFNLMLIYMGTPICNDLLKVILYLLENKDFLDKLNIFYSQQQNSIPKKQSNFLLKDKEKQQTIISTNKSQLKDEKTNNKLDIDVNLMDITRVLSEKILDNLSCNDKLILLNIILHLYNYNHSLMSIESIEPVCRCLGTKDDEIIVAALKILYLFSCPGVKIPISNFSSIHMLNNTMKNNNGFLSGPENSHDHHHHSKSYYDNTGNKENSKNKNLDESNTKRFHEELIKTNFIFRIVRVYKKSISEIDSILVMILYQLFKNNSLMDILFSNNVNLILENYLNSFDSDENDEVISTVFSIYKVIMLRNSSKISYLQKTLFEKALTLSQKNMKKENFVLNCLSMVEDIVKVNVNLKNKKDFLHLAKKKNENTTGMANNPEENQLNEILNEKSVRNVFEQIPVFFKTNNKEILNYSLNIFELVLREKLEFFEGNYIQVNDRNFSIKSMIYQLIHIINDNFANDGIINSCCEICFHLSEIQILHQYFLQEPHITILRVFCDDLILIKEELTLKEDDDLRLNKNGAHQNSILSGGNVAERKNYSLAPKKFSVLSKKFNINEKMYKAKEQSQRLLKSNDFGSIKQKNNKNLLLVETEFKLQKILKIIENLTKVSDNLEVMMNKGFLEIMNHLLENNNNPDTTNLVANCIQGFCGSVHSVNIILTYNLIEKILNCLSACKKPSKMEILLLAIKNILESNIKLQKQFILFDGITKVLKEIRLNDDRINNFVLKIVYVISCSINKLYLIDISSESNKKKKGLTSSNSLNFSISNKKHMVEKDEQDESDKSKSSNYSGKVIKLNNLEKETKQPEIEKKAKKEADPNGLIILNKIEERNSDDENNEDHEEDFNDREEKNNIANANALSELFSKLSIQLSEIEFMDKLISIGFSPKTSLYTYKEFIKILINLYLNRFYLTYFTSDKNFESILKIIEIMLNSFNLMGIRPDIIKLILIFFKFISEEESLIKKFLEFKIIVKILNYIHSMDFINGLSKDDSEMIFYNITLILLRLTEYEGHIERFDEIPNFYNSLVKLYKNNSVNGKVYILSIFKNLINEKFNFFTEENILEFIDIVIETKSSFIIYEFIELLKILVQNRNLCNKMESVFKFLTNEINSPLHKESFKKYLLELILCLSYENSNIKNFSLKNLLSLIQKLDLKLNKKTTLLILMNFSSVPQNFNYLVKGSKCGESQATIPKKNIKEIVDHLIDSDTFSQVLIQRFLINITSIENIDLSFISDKIFSTLIDAVVVNEKIQDNLLICALSILVNISNRSPQIQSISKKEKKKEEEASDQEIKKVESTKAKKSNYYKKLGNFISNAKKKNKENDENYSSSDLDSLNNKKENSSCDEKDFQEVKNDKEKDKKKNKITFNLKKNESKIKETIKDNELNTLQKAIDITKSYKASVVDNKISSNDLVKAESKISRNMLLPNTTNIMSSNKSITNINKTSKVMFKEQEKKTRKPILGNFSDIGVLEFIVSKLTNIVDIFNSLFERNNLDIASLAIMLACNLSKQISRASADNDEEISRNIENYFIKSFNKLVFKQESGKFFLIAIIKYCIFVSYDKVKVEIHKDFYKHIFNMFMDPENKVIHVELNKEDFLGNTINYILIESLLKFLNISIELNNRLQIFDEGSFKAIYDFYSHFLLRFISILQELKLPLEENYNMQDLIISILHILITFLKQETFQYKEIEEHTNYLFKKIVNTGPSFLSEELKSIFIYFLYILIHNNIDSSDIFQSEDTIKWVMKLFHIMSNSLQTDYYCLKLFSKAIKNQDENLVNLIWSSSKFLLKLYKYITIFDKDKKDESVYEDEIDYKELIKDKQKENQQQNTNNSFMGNILNSDNKKHSNTNLLATGIRRTLKDTSVLAAFSRGGSKKIDEEEKKDDEKERGYHYETLAELYEKKSIIRKESERIINILSFNTKSHSKLIETGIYRHYKNRILEKYNPKALVCNYHKEEFILIVNIFLNKENTNIICEDISSLLPILFLNKELNNNYKAQLFETYLDEIIKAEKYFQEDYLKLFGVLYNGLKQNFSDIIYLLYSFMDKYELFASAVISDTNLLIKIYEDYLIYDPSFPSEVSELALFIKIIEMYINANIFDELLQNTIGQIILKLSKNSLKIKEISIVQIITQFLFMFFQKYHQVDLSLCEEDNSSIIEFTDKFFYNEIVTCIVKTSLETHNFSNIYFFIQEALKSEENENLLKGLGKSFLYDKNFLMSFYGEGYGIPLKKDPSNMINTEKEKKMYESPESPTKQPERLKNKVVMINSSAIKDQDKEQQVGKNDKQGKSNTIFNTNIINIKELVFLLNFSASLNRAKAISFSDLFISQINNVFNKILIVTSKSVDIRQSHKDIILEEALSSLFFYFDFLVEAKINSKAFSDISDFFIPIIFNPSLTEEYTVVFVRYLQEIITKYSITVKNDILIISDLLEKIRRDDKLSGFENSLVGTVIINSSKSIIINNLDNFLSILSLYIHEYDNERLHDFLEYFNQIYLSVISEDKFNLIKKLQKYLMTELEKHDKELKKDVVFKKKLEKIAKQLYAY